MRCRADQLNASHVGWRIVRDGKIPMEFGGLRRSRYMECVEVTVRPPGSPSFEVALPLDEIVEVTPCPSGP